VSGGSAERRWWLIEIWLENRQIFKVLISDAIFFLLYLGLLTVAHYGISAVPLQADRKEFLETLHFGLVVTVWIVMACVMLLELGFALYRRGRDQQHR
jgi:hypothetical protein